MSSARTENGVREIGRIVRVVQEAAFGGEQVGREGRQTAALRGRCGRRERHVPHAGRDRLAQHAVVLLDAVAAVGADQQHPPRPPRPGARSCTQDTYAS